jgi:glucosamine kinase
LTRKDGALGIDVGGTRARAVWVDGDGVLTARHEGRGTNPSNGTVAASATILGEQIEGWLGASARDGSCLAIAVAIAGAGSAAVRDSLRIALEGRFPATRITVTSDADAALEAAATAAGGPSFALIAGTGSIAIARDRTGAKSRAGGFGFRLGDEGGGAWIGREALRHALLARDGRGPSTLLEAELLDPIDRGDGEVLAAANRLAADPRALAALATPVAAAAVAGDEIARSILQTAGRQLADLAAALATSVEPEIPLVPLGGIYENLEAVASAFRDRFASLEPHRRLAARRLAPELAVLELARRRAGANGVVP